MVLTRNRQITFLGLSATALFLGLSAIALSLGLLGFRTYILDACAGHTGHRAATPQLPWGPTHPLLHRGVPPARHALPVQQHAESAGQLAVRECVQLALCECNRFRGQQVCSSISTSDTSEHSQSSVICISAGHNML